MYKRILVPLDSSQLSECSLEHVKAIATGCDVSEVVLLRVIDQFYFTVELTNRLPGELLKNVEEAAQACADNYLSKIAKWLKKDHINVKTVIVHGNPANEILLYAAKNKIDLIIMSTHGRSGVARWALGSVADKVVHHSHIPVLIVSPKEFRESKQIDY